MRSRPFAAKGWRPPSLTAGDDNGVGSPRSCELPLHRAAGQWLGRGHGRPTGSYKLARQSTPTVAATGVRRRVLEADLNIGPAHRRNVGCARSPSRETDTLRGVSDKPCAMLAASVTVPG